MKEKKANLDLTYQALSKKKEEIAYDKRKYKRS